jgi:DtxR family transcriptional regulator, Mn-dependent transcriptional regulator
MIVYAARLWDRLRGGWRNTCRAGAPVPDSHRCESLHCPSVPLTALVEGGRATISCLQDPASPRSGRLAAYGVLPGVPMTLVQRRPVWVVRIGYSQLAMDDDMARGIRVLPDGFGEG